MDATTMPSMSSLVAKLQADFPQFYFAVSDDFRWSPQEKTIFYIETSNHITSLLHEAAHALLDHSTYNKDIELLEMERDAWNYASSQLSKTYGIEIDDHTIQQSLDTYRDWLHARSTCPTCSAIGVQTEKHQYKCIACQTKWRVNDARICALRRYTI